MEKNQKKFTPQNNTFIPKSIHTQEFRTCILIFATKFNGLNLLFYFKKNIFVTSIFYIIFAEIMY